MPINIKILLTQNNTKQRKNYILLRPEFENMTNDSDFNLLLDEIIKIYELNIKKIKNKEILPITLKSSLEINLNQIIKNILKLQYDKKILTSLNDQDSKDKLEKEQILKSKKELIIEKIITAYQNYYQIK